VEDVTVRQHPARAQEVATPLALGDVSGGHEIIAQLDAAGILCVTSAAAHPPPRPATSPVPHDVMAVVQVGM
jgi:hypothetical protein